ncbi:MULTISPECIES: chlorocatechol 1,2-dioxygenase [Burkholderiales]|uniref:Chlorocatechol 1,2-dioxygenase n=4 Tax=Bacteria TaxID=2 RepID=A0A4P7LM09_9BURK|nr:MULTISPECIES: chlorocatechol 1,2-dioxygenase [Burkholderiales]AFK33051.1 chlorocatechol-1,2-dioxygenase [Variovorax sp. DB1]QBY56528.1 chlorocatechol 1,2-dioxygenase [Cupriavidus oxalaticus]
MTNPRVHEIASAMIEAVRKVLVEHDVTESEYRAGVMYMMQVAEAKEMGLLCDVFLNSTIVEIKAAATRGSAPAIQGPYFKEEAPFVDGKLKTYDSDDHKPLLLHGTVKDDAGRAVSDAVIDIWHSTPDGRYSGFGGYHGDMPVDYYRGKVRTDAQGQWRVQTTLPAPYQIPNKGPTGALLTMMGSHTWRPAHVHFKIRKDGFEALTTQYYFEGGEWVDSDCCNGVKPELVMPPAMEQGMQAMTLDFVIEKSPG